MMSNNLYLCDPTKNWFCPKTNCHNPCYHTLDPEFAWDPTLRVRLDEGAYLPQRAHGTDAGLDLRTPVDAYVRAGGCTVIDTGVHIQLPPGMVGMLKSKSGLNVKDGIVSEGVIDEGYTGTILVKLYNHGTEAKQFSRGGQDHTAGGAAGAVRQSGAGGGDPGRRPGRQRVWEYGEVIL